MFRDKGPPQRLSFDQKLYNVFGFDTKLFESGVDTYRPDIEMPKRFEEVWAKAVNQRDEMGYMVLIRRQQQGVDIQYMPEALVITGVGSPGAIDMDPATLELMNTYLNSPGNENVYFILGHTHSKGTYEIGKQYAEGFSGSDSGWGATLDRDTMRQERDQRHAKCLGFMLATYKPVPNRARTRGHTTTLFYEPYVRPGQTQKVKEF